jgi:hypothetical protein
MHALSYSTANLVQANVDEKGNIRNEIADKWMEYLSRGTKRQTRPSTGEKHGKLIHV